MESFSEIKMRTWAMMKENEMNQTYRANHTVIETAFHPLMKLHTPNLVAFEGLPSKNRPRSSIGDQIASP